MDQIPLSSASAPGKVILCGEHAVVYGQPAIALPLPRIRATATITAATDAPRLVLPDLGENWPLNNAAAHPLAMLALRTLAHFGVDQPPPLTITLRSAIPIASGMGSGAALGAALVKALAAHLAQPISPEIVSRLVYESERFYHGTPSGIDNTVVSYEQAIWYARGSDGTRPMIEPIAIGRPLWLAIGDTGVRAPTRDTVGGVRARWQHDPAHYDRLFAEVGQVVYEVRRCLAQGEHVRLGDLLNTNQGLLTAIGVSSPELDRLIQAARTAGALGAKLSGGGGGGIMLALVDPDSRVHVAERLRAAGAVQVTQTPVQ